MRRMTRSAAQVDGLGVRTFEPLPTSQLVIMEATAKRAKREHELGIYAALRKRQEPK